MKKSNGPKILVLDVETAPVLAHVWGIWDQNVGLNQIKQDWFILSFCAKWKGSPASDVIYFDQRKSRNVEDDRPLLRRLWKLLDEADIILTQNGNRFDTRRINARFALNDMPPPSSYRKIDTLLLTRKHFDLTSYKLEYLSDKFCTKYKKLKHKEFPGFEMWKECLAGNPKAWKAMEVYNKHDVLALEELYDKLSSWDTSINYSVYHETIDNVCKCGSKKFKKNGFKYTNSAKYQRYKCVNCQTEFRDKNNLLSKEKRQQLKVGV